MQKNLPTLAAHSRFAVFLFGPVPLSHILPCTIRHGRILPFLKKNLIRSFGRTKLQEKKMSRNIYIIYFYLIKLSRFWCQFSSSALVESNIWLTKCLLLLYKHKVAR